MGNGGGGWTKLSKQLKKIKTRRNAILRQPQLNGMQHLSKC